MFRKLLNFLFGKPPTEPVKDTWKDLTTFPTAPPPAPPVPVAEPAPVAVVPSQTMNPKAEWPFARPDEPPKQEAKKPRKPRATPAPATKEKTTTKKKKK